MRLFLMTLFGVLFYLQTIAQARLSGTVRDAETNEPIIFANIALLRNGALVTAAESDFDGYYCITEIEEEVYEVEITFTGYNSVKISGVDFSEDSDIVLDLQLWPGLKLADIYYCCFCCPPIIEQDNTTQGVRFSAMEIKRSPFR